MPYYTRLLQIRPQYTDSSSSVHENVTWWQFSGSVGLPVSLTELEAVQAQFDTDWYTLWALVGATGTHYIGSVVTDWQSDTGLEAGNSSFDPLSAGGGVEAGAQVSALLSYQEGLRYKGGHARTYLPCVGINNISNGKNLTSAIPNNLETAWNSVVANQASLTGGPTAPIKPVVFHQKPKSGIPFVQPIVDVVASLELATQRRRLRKAAHT